MKQMQIIGHLGKDAEIVHYQGEAFLSFSVAISKKIQDVEKTTWVKCTTNQTKIAEYLTKGKQVFCQGSFSIHSYYSEKYNKTLPEIRLNCSMIQLLTPKNTESNNEENLHTDVSNNEDEMPF